MIVKKGTNCCIVEFQGKDYFSLKDCQAPFKQNGKALSPDPNVVLCVAAANETVIVDPADELVDINGTVSNAIVGGRPSNIHKR